MISSTFSTEHQNTKYILPLDAIDLAYLPVRRIYGDKDVTVPLWRKESDDMYFEFEVLQVDNDPGPAATFTKPDEEKLSLTTYLKIIRALTKTPTALKLTSFDEDTIVIHVQSKKVYVSVNNFHGYAKSGDDTLCRVCRVVTGQRDTHMLSERHMEIVSGYISDVNCVRKVDQLWSHCILCNEIIENKEFHLTCSSEHALRLRDALCSTPVSNDKKHHGTASKQAVIQSHGNGLPKLDIAQNNNVVSSYNTARITNNNLRSPVNNVVSSWERTSNNKQPNLATNSKNETPNKNNVKLRPEQVYCDVCDRVMLRATLKSHQKGNDHKSNLQMLKNKQEIEAKKAISNNVSPKPAENIRDSSNVCICGTVFLSIYHKRTHFSGKTHQDYVAKQIEEKTAKNLANDDKIVNAGTSKNLNSSEICGCGIEFLLKNKRAHYLIQHHREYVEKQNMKAENNKIVKAGTSNETTLVKNQNNTTKNKPYWTLPDRQVFCTACNFKMHENNLQSHLKGRNHAANVSAKGIKIGQCTENNSFKTVKNTESNSFKTVQNTENNSFKAVQNTENNSFRTAKNTENNSFKAVQNTENNSFRTVKTTENNSYRTAKNTENNSSKTAQNTENNTTEYQEIPSYKVVEKDIESNTKQLVFFNSKYTLTDCSVKNKESSMQTKGKVDTETSNAVAKEKSNVNKKPIAKENVSVWKYEFPRGKENILVLKQAEEATKQNTEDLKERAFDGEIDLAQKQEAIADTMKILVAKKRRNEDIETKDSYKIETILFTNIPGSKVDVEPTNTEKSELIGEKQEQSNKEQDIDEKIRNLVERKNNIEIKEKRNDGSFKNKSKIEQHSENKSNSPKIDTKLQTSSNTEDIAERIKNLVSRKVNIDTVVKKDLFSNTSKHVIASDAKPVVSQKIKALDNKTNSKIYDSDFVEPANTEQGVVKTNIEVTLRNSTGTVQKDAEITQNDTEITQKGAKITREDTDITQNDTEMTETGTKMTPKDNQQEMESAKETSLKKRNSFTVKIRNLVTRVRNKNDTSHVDESFSISETEISEEAEPVKKQHKKLDLATRLRNYVARERAKRKNANSEENK